MIIHNPGNYMKIDEMYAFVSVDPKGLEGVIAMQMGGVAIPFVAADKDRVDSLRPLVKDLVKRTGQKVSLLRFSTRELLESFE